MVEPSRVADEPSTKLTALPFLARKDVFLYTSFFVKACLRDGLTTFHLEVWVR